MVLGARYNQGAVFNFGGSRLCEVGLYTANSARPERDQLEDYLKSVMV